MAHKPPTKFARPIRHTLRWLVPDAALANPRDAIGETRYLLCHAHRLHESLTRLPSCGTGYQPVESHSSLKRQPLTSKHVTGPQASGLYSRCLIVGSWGLEVPFLADRLGWSDITCIAAPRGHAGEVQHRTRQHPNADQSYDFTFIEHDIEFGPLPFDDGSFALVVYCGCIEHLRHNPEFSLYELNRVTAPGGTLSLVTDNAISFQATHSMLRGDPMPMRLHWPDSEGHWRLYSPKEIEELAQGTGWRVDLLTTIVPDAPVYWKWWKRWLFKKMVRDLRQGFGLPEPYWNAFILAHATKIATPTRSYPTWLYKDEKIRQLKVEMLELVTCGAT